jgi:hypothetical protein
MKKLFTLLFTFALVFSLAMPMFAQGTTTTGQETTPKVEKKHKKHLGKHKKEPKEEKTGEGTPPKS